MSGWWLAGTAVAAGVVSAASPCVLPVIPGYLATVSSADGTDRSVPALSLRGATGFVSGFTVIFVLLGATASALGSALYSHLTLALRLAGGGLIVLGLASLGVLNIPTVSRERRPIGLDRAGRGPRRSVLLGAVFALGWTPCIGPVLATILTKAAADSSLGQGMLLLLCYSAGLGLPFIAVAAWFERSRRPRVWLAHHGRTLQRVGGVTMIVVGVGYVTGIWATVFTGLQGWLTRMGWPPF